MLSHERIIRQLRFDAQYGLPEHSFDPRWHEENSGPGPDAIPAIRKGERIVRACIRSILLPSGDVTIDNVGQGYVLPEGASFIH